MKLPAVVREINVFVLVGVTATACNTVTAVAANRFLNFEPQVASLVGYASSVGISYLGNSLFTFRRPAIHGAQFARFAGISLAGLAINQGIVFLCVHLWNWPFLLAQAPVVLIVPAATFVMSKFWAFRTPAAEPVS